MEVFKVARPTNREGVFKSAIITEYPSLIYEIGKVTIAKPYMRKRGYYPLCFDNLRTAIAWTRQVDDAYLHKLVVLRCVAEGSVKAPDKHGWMYSSISINYASLRIFMRDAQAWGDFPKGSLMCERVTPINLEWVPEVQNG